MLNIREEEEHFGLLIPNISIVSPMSNIPLLLLLKCTRKVGYGGNVRNAGGGGEC